MKDNPVRIDQNIWNRIYYSGNILNDYRKYNSVIEASLIDA